jgi:DNA invertase Pin-like site-specific DNA recombinase
MDKVLGNRVFCYARVSTSGQEKGLESQLRALSEYCKRFGISDYTVFQDENQSGAKSSRPGLDAMMNAVRNGEAKSVIVYSFSRYARSVSHLLKALEEFDQLGVSFISLTESIDTSTPLGRSVFVILGAVAQLERDLIRERVRNGLANAKAKGVRLGREKKRDSHLIRSLRLSGLTYREVGRIARCSSGCVASEIRQMKKDGLLDEKGKPVIQASTKRHSPPPSTTPSPAGQLAPSTDESQGDLEVIRF